ncbi:MAG: hypothetical protein BWY71_02328 [Planctomycetes bacterium ADurb.Bin412]|nr:MAG: hypothetical protein BWY71_02328 [Planctomycetes bacterium ADurb.Bin412]
MGAQQRNTRNLRTGKIRQGPDLFVPEQEHGLPDHNRQADGNHDQTQNRSVANAPDEYQFDQPAHDRRQQHRRRNRQRQRQQRQQADSDHGAQNKKLTLGKINNAGRIVDDIETDGHDGIDTAHRNSGEAILYNLGKTHEISLTLSGRRPLLVVIDREFSLFHRQHLKGIHPQAIVVPGGKIEYPGRTHQALQVLHGIADLVPIGGTGFFDRLR